MKIKYIIWIVLSILIILFAIFVFSIKNINYEEIADDALSAYYITGDPSELDEILYFLDDYSFHEETVEEVQRYVNKKVNSWYEFLDNKFTCTIDNNLACNVYLEEFLVLNSKLVVLNEKVSEKGLKLMIRGDFEIIYDQASKKVDNIRFLINYIESQKDVDYLTNCSLAVCNECVNGICKCTYTDEYLNIVDILCEEK